MVVLPKPNHQDVSLVLCGAAGQGVQTVEEILVKALHEAGFHVFASREYMSRVRGGNNSTEIRVSSKPVNALVDRIDILIPFNSGLRQNIVERIDEGTIIIGDGKELWKELSELGSFVDVGLFERAQTLGGKVYAGTLAAGIVAGLMEIDRAILYNYFEGRFAGRADVIDKNKRAVDAGYEMAQKLKDDNVITVTMKVGERSNNSVVLNGTDAVSLGALAGGCDFLTSYPMSPATGVLTFMAKNARSALKLGHARGVALLAGFNHDLPIAEYSALQVKSAVVGYGRADKKQIQEMVRILLKLPEIAQEDASDALAVAICHAHSAGINQRVAGSGGANRR